MELRAHDPSLKEQGGSGAKQYIRVPNEKDSRASAPTCYVPAHRCSRSPMSSSVPFRPPHDAVHLDTFKKEQTGPLLLPSTSTSMQQSRHLLSPLSRACILTFIISGRSDQPGRTALECQGGTSAAVWSVSLLLGSLDEHGTRRQRVVSRSDVPPSSNS